MKTVPAASAAPQQQAYARAYRDVAAHVELDEAFAKLRAGAESHAGLLQKQAAVRVRNWLKKLSEETANVVWKRNRNAYARLLVEQLRCGKLVEPFTGQPPGGPLPTLPKHLAYAFKPPRSSPAAVAAAPATGRSPGAAPAASGPQGAHVATQQLLSQQAASQGMQQQSLLSASEQLDEYLGRADFRRAEAAEEEAAVASAFVPRDALVSGGLRAAGGGAGGSAPQLLPGTRMQLRGAEGRRVDRHQLGDVGWQPSKLELEAQLGASRERQAQLEWRLSAMETLLKQHLAPAAPAAPLGSLLDAIDDGHMSPPRSTGHGKQELDELIQRYEAKRQQWRSPAWAAGSVSSGGGGGSPRRRPAQPPLEPSEGAEMLQQLDAFQRQTDTIRRALGGSGGNAGAVDESVLAPRQLASSLAAAASEWGGPEVTPVRQHPSGLWGSGHMPSPGAFGSTDLFDGLPPSPAALAASSWMQQQQQHANRHVQHAGHHCHEQPQQQAVQAPAAIQASGWQVAAVQPDRQRCQQQQRPRSPIGPDVRHTKKSAAAATAGASSALQRLKGRRPASAGVQAEVQAAPASAPSPQHAQLQPPDHGFQHALPPSQQWQKQQQPQPPQPQAASPWQEAALGVPVQPAQGEAAAAASPAPQPPPDSNAALVAEVRQLRDKLLQSLQKHAPELKAAGVGLSLFEGSNAYPSTSKLFQATARQQAEPEAAGSPGSSWRLGAVVTGDASPPATTGRSAGMFRLTDQSSLGGEAWPPANSTASSNKFRLTDDSGGGGFESGRQRLSELGGSFGGTGSLGGSLGGGLGGMPTSVLDGCRGTGLPRLGSLDAGGGFSLEAFEAQTEALRRQLAGL